MKHLWSCWRYGALLIALSSLASAATYAQETPKAETAPEATAAPAETPPAETPSTETPAETPPAAMPPGDAPHEAPGEGTPAETATDSAPPPAGLSTADLKVMGDTVWVLITGFLVFFMNLGFACVESGMCRAKNAVNILSKNFIVFAVTTIGFWLVGWGIMFGNNPSNGFFGTEGLLMIAGADNSPATGSDYQGAYSAISWTGIPLMAKFFFQLVFAGTAATIVSGAVAERIKYLSFIVFSFIMAICIYPVVGHWIWGGGFLASRGFVDFAGCTQVHSIGGWAALAGVIMLGPRIGKYSADGRVNAIPGHNMTAATIGCLILWFGWFGFNPGSTMGLDALAISEIAVTTNMAAAAATLTATATCWLLLGKPDIGMTLNGCLAGLVAITASCAFVTVGASVIIGAIAGVVVVLAVIGFDKIKIDDPVGATSVHLVCGVLGTIAVGLFSTPDRIARSGNTAQKPGLFYGGGFDQLIEQFIGIGATAVYVLAVSFLAWAVLKAVIGIRVSKEEELEGLDKGEHGNEAYHGFVMTSINEG
jgi:Amt family ammonium transporter